jgi:hypothetical protein
MKGANMSITIIYISPKDEGWKEPNNPFTNFDVLFTEQNPASLETVQEMAADFVFETFYYNRELVKAFGGWMKLYDEYGDWAMVDTGDSDDTIILLPVMPMSDDDIADYARERTSSWADNDFPRQLSNLDREEHYSGIIERTVDPLSNPDFGY